MRQVSNRAAEDFCKGFDRLAETFRPRDIREANAWRLIAIMRNRIKKDIENDSGMEKKS